MKSILFSGCSFVNGVGLENEHKNPKHFSNIFAGNVFGSDYHIDNIGVVGHSNERIFLDSAVKLTKHKYDYAFVCWTALHRYIFWLGLELYESKRSFLPSKRFSRIDEIGYCFEISFILDIKYNECVERILIIPRELTKPISPLHNRFSRIP